MSQPQPQSQPQPEPPAALLIRVLRWLGAPLPAGAIPPAFEFGPGGGCLGREEGCELHLPDPNRHVSRLQARIECDGQGFWLVDLGSNPTRVDGQPLGRGQRWPLAGGERIEVGDYELEVVALLRGAQPALPLPPARPAVDDPFAVFAAAALPAQPAPVALKDCCAPPASLSAGLASLLPGAADRADGSDLPGMGDESASIDELFGLHPGTAHPGGGLVLSWESDQPLTGPPQPRSAWPESGAVPLSQREAPVEAPAEASGEEAVAMTVKPSVKASVEPPGVVTPAELLDALQRGLGQPLQLPAWLTPALMERVGQLLRDASQGRQEPQRRPPDAEAG